MSCLRNWINKITDGDGLYLFVGKQFFGAFIGFLIATSWGSGEKLYKTLSRAPTCSISFVSLNTVGLKYHWKISVKNEDSGSLLIYPKDDIIIKLASLKKSDRVIKIVEIDPSSGIHAKGIALDYIDSQVSKKIEVEFDTYSSKKLDINNTKVAACSDLLLDL